MDLNTNLALLEEIYRIYDDFAVKLNVACKRYCSECCTRNVTLTTLEAYKIVNYLRAKDQTVLFRRLEVESYKKRFQPETTTNGLANLCIQGEEIPDEENNYIWGKCPLLHNDECPLYPARPFMCRCFLSKQNCREQGHASIDPFVLTVNNVFLQYIEHIDAHGFTGNLTEILLFLESEDNRQAYENKAVRPDTRGLIPNQPIKALFIPPEHRDKIKPILQSIQAIKLS